MANRLPNFETYSEPGVLLLLDLGPWDVYPTITNAAEQVVGQVAPLLEGRRLEYIDSEGERAEIVVEDGRFAGFKPASV